MSDMTVANTILAQLGGNRFRAMTGASNFVGSDTSLTFMLPGTPGFVKNKIRYVRITLTSADLYLVEGLKVRRRFEAPEVVASVDNVDFENLRGIFTNMTGLETSLGSMGR